MKIVNRSLFETAIVILVVALMPWGARSQNTLTTAQRNLVINRTDSVMNLYKRYSTFVEDAGNYSKTYSAQFIKLFGEKALVFNDVDPETKTQGKANGQLLGLTPQVYVIYVQNNYPSGIGIADFNVEKRSEPVSVNGGKEYEITVTGQKKIETFTVNDKVFAREFPDYEIKISCKSDFTNFKISAISLTGSKLITSLPPPPADEGIVTVTNAQGKPVSGAIVILTVDGKEVGQKISKPDGKVYFKLLAKGKDVLVSGKLNSDSTSGSLPLTYDAFIKQNVELKLTKKATTSMVFKIVDSKSMQPIAEASVLYTTKGKSVKYQTEMNGSITITGLESGEKFDLLIEKDGFAQKKEAVAVNGKNMAERTIKVDAIPDRKEVCFFVASGKNLPAVTQSGTQNWESKSGSGFAVGLGYNYYAKNLKMKFFDLGLYGNLSYVSSKSEGSSAGYLGQYEYTDVENDKCVLNVLAKDISETYNISAIDLGFGAVFSKDFLEKKLIVSLNVGPVFSYTMANSFDLNSGTVAYSAVYSNYYNTELSGIDRLGYSKAAAPAPVDNSLMVKKLNIGLNIGATIGYALNKQIGVNAGLYFRKILTNMIDDNSPGYISYLLNDQGKTIPVQDYKSLFNTLDKYTQSLIGLQLGLTYKIQ